MKKLLILLLLATGLEASAQSSFAYTPYFSAVIVKDLDVSVKWYSSVFGLKTKDVMEDPNGAYRISILESEGYLLELLQLKESVTREEALKGKLDAKLQGHFKYGFSVKDMAKVLNHLSSLKVDTSRIYTDQKTGKRNLLITDPDGNLIQFFE